MRHTTIILFLILLCTTLSGIASAEPVGVEVSGSTRIRGNYFTMDSLGTARFIQQNTRINVKVDFTPKISGVVDVDSRNARGGETRSSRHAAARPTGNSISRLRQASR